MDEKVGADYKQQQQTTTTNNKQPTKYKLKIKYYINGKMY
jgi:hypothetical protein